MNSDDYQQIKKVLGDVVEYMKLKYTNPLISFFGD